MSIVVREVMIEDAGKGILEALENMSEVGDLKVSEAKSILKRIKANPVYNIFVAVKGNKVVGTTTLLVEQKLIHKGGKVGHIEDVSVNENYTGQGIGKKLMKRAVEEAKKSGCYKVILDCDLSLIPFYEKFNFQRKEIQMRLDLK